MTALVFSAGGMFGAWQAGAWAALARRCQPDAVVGASVGALNGWAVSAGVAAAELAADWLDPAIADLIHPRFPFPTLFDPAPLERTARLLFERHQPRVPFAATLVEMPRLRLRLVRDREMTWQHLAAACSIPLCYPARRLDGHWYVDGGLLGALPLWAAGELGATRVIAVDALPLMPSRLLRVGVSAVRALGDHRQLAGGVEVIHLRPSRPLGRVRDAIRWNADNTRRWLAQGEQDAGLSFTM